MNNDMVGNLTLEILSGFTFHILIHSNKRIVEIQYTFTCVLMDMLFGLLNI